MRPQSAGLDGAHFILPRSHGLVPGAVVALPSCPPHPNHRASSVSGCIIRDDDRYDDWALFLDTLSQVNEREKSFLLDLLTVAAAFDGRLSDMERLHLSKAYQEDNPLYENRLRHLTTHLKQGRLNAALALCRLDFIRG